MKKCKFRPKHLQNRFYNEGYFWGAVFRIAPCFNGKTPEQKGEAYKITCGMEEKQEIDNTSNEMREKIYEKKR